VQFLPSFRFVARLRVRHALQEAGPICTARPVNAPVFVLGLPRTGTTFLHRLLSLDPASRCPLTYELFDPGAHGLQVLRVGRKWECGA
jgi:hypothetical protein